jgi:alkaline phosphatase D
METARQHSIDFLVFLGDFIYSDVPGRVFSKPKTLESFRRFYRQLYSSADLRKIYEVMREFLLSHFQILMMRLTLEGFLAIFHMLDDHEIENDYSKGQLNDTGVLVPALSAYELYNGRANYDGPGEGTSYYWWR